MSTLEQVSDQTIISTIRALISKEYSFEAFLVDRQNGAKERVRQQLKNKKRYDQQKALRQAKQKIKDQGEVVHKFESSESPLG